MLTLIDMSSPASTNKNGTELSTSRLSSDINVDNSDVEILNNENASSGNLQDTDNASDDKANLGSLDSPASEDSYDPEVDLSIPDKRENQPAVDVSSETEISLEQNTNGTPQLYGGAKEQITEFREDDAAENAESFKSMESLGKGVSCTNNNVETNDLSSSAEIPSNIEASAISDLDDEYDPAENLAVSPSSNKTVPNLPVRPNSNNFQQNKAFELQEAYNAVMQSDIVKSKEFASLNERDQMNVIQKLLKEKNIVLPESESTEKPDIAETEVDETALKEAYEHFLQKEAEFLSQRSNIVLPDNSRLFVGNLPSHETSKEEIFRIFQPYGSILEIVLKNAYGFVQFETAESAAECIRNDHKMVLHGRHLRLSPSHKQRNDALNSNSRARERHARSTIDLANELNANDLGDLDLLVTEAASGGFVKEIEEQLTANGLTFSSKLVSDKDLTECISEAAYSGNLGVCIVKESAIDLQVFEKLSEGGIKFDEFVDITPIDVCEIVTESKKAKRSNNSRAQEAPAAGKLPQRDKRNAYDVSGPHHNTRKRPYQNSFLADEYNHGSSSNNPSGHKRRYDRGHDHRKFFALQNTETAYPPQPPMYLNPSSSYPSTQPYGGHTTNHGVNFDQSGMWQQGSSDAALLNTLQNLDPVTKQNLISLLQSQNVPNSTMTNPPYQQQPYQQYQLNYNHSLPSEMSAPSMQVNSLLAQLSPHEPQQMQSVDYSPRPPPPPQLHQPAQAYQSRSSLRSAGKQPAQPNSVLMDMLARLAEK